MQMDSLYYTMMGWTRRRPSGVVQVSQTKTLDEMLTLAQTYTAQRLTQGQVLDLSADNPYDRQAAVAYAHEWVGQRNDEWGDYGMYGGNCQNFVSQALLAGGIPMDIEGDAVWKWYGSTPSDTNRASGRSASFSGVEAFLS